MATKTFDNQGGGGDGQWETGANWDPVNVPADNDDIVISADCTVSTDYRTVPTIFENLVIDAGITLTVASGGDLGFDTDNSTIAGTLHIDSGGAVQFSDANWTFSSGSELALDGGTITVVRTTGAVILGMSTGSTLSGTANGGTVNLSTTSAAVARLDLNGGTMQGNSASRILVDCGAGAQPGEIYIAGAYNYIQYAKFQDGRRFYLLGTYTEIANCVIDGFSQDGVQPYFDLVRTVVIRDSFIHGITGWGFEGIDNGQLYCFNTVFGETEGASPDANSLGDVRMLGTTAFLYNCKLSSATEVSCIGGEIISVAHDQDKNDWRHWQGRGHYAQPEFGAGAQGASGTAIKCTSVAGAADNDSYRFRRLVATIPRTHGETIDLTIYHKGTNLDADVTFRIDPENLFGTTKSVTSTPDDSWNQRTIPQFTVNTVVGDQHAIPVYMDVVEASKVHYYDTAGGV